MTDKKPKTEAQKRAQKRYMSKMDYLQYVFPKEKKPLIVKAAETVGLSLNAFVDRAVDHEIENVLGKDPSDQD